MWKKFMEIYENIKYYFFLKPGRQIKNLAVFIFWAGVFITCWIAIGMVDSGAGFWAVVLTFIAGVTISRLSVLLLYGFGEIISLLDELNGKLTGKEEKLEEAYQAKVTYLKPDTETVTNTTTNFWECEKCGTKNTINARFCKDCGEYKHKE